MSYLNSIYAGIVELKKMIVADKELSLLYDAIKHAPRDDDKLEAERMFCVVEEEWVEKIEKELVFIAKAIEEDRQFIIQNGEVVPIEKVKKVSNASVRHLARHSNQITREQEGEDVVPEKLYMVENLTNYDIYENKFLYMLLCYLRDFIDVRLSEILEVGSTYRAKMTVKKELHIKKRKITLATDIFDEDKQDPLSDNYTKSGSVIERIKDAQFLVSSLLMTPLMREVAKAPMIKPPITKTNVLRMNNNFIHAMDLYHFISAYDKKGYRVEKIKTTIAPLSDHIIEEYSHIALLNVYLEYKYGNNLSQTLTDEYNAEQERIFHEKQKELSVKLQALKERIGENSYEYILALEEKNRSLEAVYNKLKETKLALQETTKRLEENAVLTALLEKDVEFYKREVDDKLYRLQETEQSCQQKIQAFTEERDTVTSEYKRKLENLNQEIESGVNAQKSAWLDSAKNDFDAKNQALEEEFCKRRQELENESVQLKSSLVLETQAYKTDCDRKVSSLQTTIDGQNAEIEKLKEQNSWIMAQLNGIRAQHNLTSSVEDYTSMERFNELENEFEAFAKFFRAQWSKTKKQIRKEILWKKSLDGDKKD